MSDQAINVIHFNQHMDKLVENLISRNLVSSEYRVEYVKAAGLYRRVAEYAH